MNAALIQYVNECVTFWTCDPVFTGLLVLSFFESLVINAFYFTVKKKEQQRKEQEREMKRNERELQRRKDCLGYNR